MKSHDYNIFNTYLLELNYSNSPKDLMIILYIRASLHDFLFNIQFYLY